jgi:hypothetical protein
VSSTMVAGSTGLCRTGAGLAEQRVVRVLVGRHVGRVVGEVRDAVEGAVGFGEVHPALGAGARAFEADARPCARPSAGVRRASTRCRGHVALEHVAEEDVERHGGDEVVVASGCAVGEGDGLGVDVDRDGFLVEADVSAGEFAVVIVEAQREPEAAVELARAALERELEAVVGPPAEVVGRGRRCGSRVGRRSSATRSPIHVLFIIRAERPRP